MMTQSDENKSETIDIKSQMPITIFIAEQGEKIHYFVGKFSDSVREVKQAIGADENKRLFFKNKPLRNDLTLFDYNV